MSTATVSLIIPVFNEQRRLPACLAAVRAHLDAAGDPYEVILVDDGSTDDTGSIAQQSAAGWRQLRVLRHARNLGKGASVHDGMLEAGGKYVFLIDADLSPSLAALEKLKEHLRQGADLVLASRHLPGSGSTVKQPAYRRLLGGIFRLLVRTCLLPGINDSPWGCKGFRLAAAKKLAARQLSKGFAFDVELLYLARKLGFVLKQAPLAWADSPGSRRRPAADGWKILWELGAIPFWHGDRRRLAVIALVLLLTLSCVLRFFCLGADPSPSLENYFITDEGWWVHNARNFALFGRWVRDDFNQGFLYAPVHSLFLSLSFRAFGVGFVSARAISAAAGLLTVLFLYLAARSAGEGRRTALLAAGFLATSNMFVSLNRLAYPESLMICFAVLGWWCWLKGRYTLAGVALGLSCFTKLAGLPGIALPVLLLGRRFYDDFRKDGGFRQLDRADRLCRLRQEIIRPGLRYLAGLTGVSSLIGAVIWLPNLRLLASTYAMTKYFNSPSSCWNILGNLVQFPANGFLAQTWLLWALTWLYLLARSGPIPIAPREQAMSTPSVSDAGPHLALSWLAVNALAIAPLRFHPVHRYLVFLPALAWLAARGWQILPRLRWRAAARGVFMRATDWHLGISLLICWPFYRLLAVLLTPALIGTGLPAFRAGSAAAYCFAFVWCALLTGLLLPWAGRMIIRRQSPAAAALDPLARPRPRALLVLGIAAVWFGVNLWPAGREASRPSWDLRRIARSFAARTAEARVMGLTADTALLETPAFSFTPRIGIFNQDPYARFHPTHVLVMSAIDGRVLGQDAWFEEGSKFSQPLRTARLVWTSWAVDGGRLGAKRFRLQLYELKGE